MEKRNLRLSAIIGSFAVAIAAGSLLLALPVSSAEGRWTPLNETLFTAVSATCVTGLVVRDTATYWSVFGQVVILLMIQMGGLGVITVVSTLAGISGRRKIGLVERSMLQEELSQPQLGGIVRQVRFMAGRTLVTEAAGAALLAIPYCRDFGPSGLWMAAFHSVSAFCNAGFDILGGPTQAFDSLVFYQDDVLVNVVTSALIVMGGIGFLTWKDVRAHGLSFRRYRLQTKIVLTLTLVLIVVPSVGFFLFELQWLSPAERVLPAVFQAITPRTAGFNTVDLNELSSVGKVIVIALMLVGASPGSTAGGMKVTTVAVLMANSLAVFRRRSSVRLFGRTISDEQVRRASTVLTMYLVLFVVGGCLLYLQDGVGLAEALFECASAIGTVGLSLGVTPILGLGSQLLLSALMFCGRVGGLSLVYLAFAGGRREVSRLPHESVMIG